MEDKKKLLEDSVEIYVFGNIVNIEIRLYQQYCNKKAFVKDIRSQEMCNFVNGYIAIEHFNNCYSSLVKGDSTYEVTFYNLLKHLVPHSHLCLLNVIFHLKVIIHSSLDRKKFDISSEDKYIESIKKQLNSKNEELKDFLNESLNHECDQEDDITKHDPNKRYFDKDK